MINEDYVSFETARLLKEKGFDWEVHRTYIVNANVFIPGDINDVPLRKDAIRIPTLQMAMKWLRKKYKLDITVVPFPLDFEHEDIQDGWGCEVTHLSDLSYDGNYEFFQKRYPTHEEACEAGIKYCLENLI